MKRKNKVHTTFRYTFIFPFIIIAATLLLLNCTNEKEKKSRTFPEYESWMDSLLVTKEKIIRGIEPGTYTELVIQNEKIAPTEQDSGSLYYEFLLDSVSTFSVNYSIANGKVREIELIVLSKSTDHAAEIYEGLKTYYTEKYSVPVSEKGICIFSGQTSNGENLKISLEDAGGVQEGKIVLLVYLE